MDGNIEDCSEQSLSHLHGQGSYRPTAVSPEPLARVGRTMQQRSTCSTGVAVGSVARTPAPHASAATSASTSAHVSAVAPPPVDTRGESSASRRAPQPRSSTASNPSVPHTKHARATSVQLSVPNRRTRRLSQLFSTFQVMPLIRAARTLSEPPGTTHGAPLLRRGVRLGCGVAEPCSNTVTAKAVRLCGASAPALLDLAPCTLHLRETLSILHVSR